MNSENPRRNPSSDRPLLHGVDWAVEAGVTEEVMLGSRRRSRQRRAQRFVMAGASCALALGMAVWFSSAPRRAVTPIAATQSAVLDAPARQTLPDGTVVELKEGAEIALAYTPETRRVVLLRGEAHFQVVKNPARPFVVAVDSVEVRAVGTSFAVQRRPAQVEVLVTTGRVAVDRLAEAASGSPLPLAQTIATLDAGNRTLVDAAAESVAPVVEPVSAAEINQRLAWRVPRLEFTRTPLADAIPMINQHSAIKLSLGDPALGAVRISGLLRVDNVETLFHLLETEHGIKAERLSATEVVLQPGR